MARKYIKDARAALLMLLVVFAWRQRNEMCQLTQAAKSCCDCCAKTTLAQRGGEGLGVTLAQIGFPSLSQEMKDLEGGKEPKRRFPKYHGGCYWLLFHPAEGLGLQEVEEEAPRTARSRGS